MPTREETLEHIAEMSNFRAVQVKDTAHLRVLATPEGFQMRPGGRKSYRIGEEGIVPTLAFAGIPKGLATALNPRTTAQALEEVLRKAGALTLLAREEELTDVTKPGKYNPIDPERVFRTVERSVPDFEVHRILDLPHHTVSLQLLGVDEPRPVRGEGHAAVNDLIRAGVLVEFSPLGLTDPLVQAFAMRLVCTNGAVANDVLREFHFGGRRGGEGDDVWQFFRKSAREAYRAIGRIVERYEQLRRDEVAPADRAMILAAVIKEAGLGQEARAAIEARALENPPQNAFDVYNLITWGSSHVEQDSRRVRRAQRAAANFSAAETHLRFCPTCRHTH